jgi:hypothetical protein
MPTREQVRRLRAVGHDYAAVGRALGIPAGQAYLIMTGMPADGGEEPCPADAPEGTLASAQHLVYPPAENPTASEGVHRWMARRAADMGGAGR